MSIELVNPSYQQLGTSLSCDLLARLYELSLQKPREAYPPEAAPSASPSRRKLRPEPDPHGAAERLFAARSPADLSKIPLDLSKKFANPVQRRAWLLLRALETNTFEDALELARKAEALVVGR